MVASQVVVEGTQGILDALQALGAQAPSALAQGLFDEGEEIMAKSKGRYVPVDTGVLRGTGHVSLPEVFGPVTSVTLAYGGPAAPYALAVHENPRAGKTGGFSPQGKPYKHWAQVGEWKYLETPWKAAVSGMVSRLEAFLRGRVRALA